jgi:hypothetical protein
MVTAAEDFCEDTAAAVVAALDISSPNLLVSTAVAMRSDDCFSLSAPAPVPEDDTNLFLNAFDSPAKADFSTASEVSIGR